MALICEVPNANPNTGLQFSWSLNGTALNDSYVEEIANQEGLRSRIVIPAGDEELFGTWTCSVRNTVGQTDPNCTLFVDAPLSKFFIFFTHDPFTRKVYQMKKCVLKLFRVVRLM